MSFMRTTAWIAPFVAGCAMIVGCATAPSTRADRNDLRETADATLGEMITRDPALRDVTRDAPAYAVFPSVGKGGVLVGGAFGRGILYEGGVATGYVSLQQASPFQQFVPRNLTELVRTINKMKMPDRLYVQTARSTQGAIIGTSEMPNLPPSVLATINNERSVGGVKPVVQTFLSENAVPPATFIIGGQQTITIEVVK